MPTVLPQSESLRHAVKWISDRLREDRKQSQLKLVQEAVFRFNLSPKDEIFLYQLYQRQTK